MKAMSARIARSAPRAAFVAAFAITAACGPAEQGTASLEYEVRQITQGPKHHFFGYIGHVQNIPWNGNVALFSSR